MAETSLMPDLDKERRIFLGALMLWDYNVSAEERFRAVFPASLRSDGYYQEKVDLIERRGTLYWFSTLDSAIMPASDLACFSAM